MQKTEPLVPGKTYKIVQFGNGDEPLFFEPANVVYFKALMEKHLLPISEILNADCSKYKIALYLRFRDRNDIPEKYRDRLHLPLSNLFNSYAKAINKYYGRQGSLFRTRFERWEISADFQF